MKLSLVTVAFDRDAGAFPDDPLAEVADEISSVVEHFFHYEARPHPLLVVHHRAEADTERADASEHHALAIRLYDNRSHCEGVSRLRRDGARCEAVQTHT